MASHTDTLGQNQSRSTIEIVQDILNNIGELIRSEIRLAKTELKEEAAQAGKAGGLFAAAGLVAFYGGAALVAACIIALAMVMPLWFAALIMAIVLVIAAGILFATAREKWKAIKPPERTLETLKDDVKWVKQRTT